MDFSKESGGGKKKIVRKTVARPLDGNVKRSSHQCHIMYRLSTQVCGTAISVRSRLGIKGGR